MTLRRGLPVWLVLALVVGSAADARDEVPIPGLVMDATSKRLLAAWSHKAYNLGRAGLARVECRLALENPVRPSQSMVEGRYRYDLVKSDIEWTRPDMGRMLEHNWWRFELDTLLRSPGRRFYLAHSKLTAAPSEAGARVEVEGESIFKALHFDAKGVLTRCECMLPSATGGMHEATIDLTFRAWQGKQVLQQYTMRGNLPGAGAVRERGSFAYTRLFGRPVPTAVLLDLSEGGKRLKMKLAIRDWKQGVEVGPDMDSASRARFTTWEAREYNLGRLGYRKASCVVEARMGARRATGTYRWDGKRGTVTWQDAEAAQQIVRPDWSKTLDRLFERYPRRSRLGGHVLKGQRAGRSTNVMVTSQFRLTGELQRFTFGPDGALTEMTVGGTAAQPEGVVRLTHRRYLWPTGSDLAGRLRYVLPMAWAGSWGGGTAGPYRTRKTLQYALHQHVHVPSVLTLSIEGKGFASKRVLRFSGWKLAPEPVLWR